MSAEIDIEFKEPSAIATAVQNASSLAAERAKLAEALRTEYPGQWAVISKGHATIKSAGVVRRRLLQQDTWADFEMTSRKAEDGSGHIILGRYVGPKSAEAEQPAEGAA